MPAELPTIAPMPLVEGEQLPLLGQVPRERADAACNRRKILAAAERLFAERGVEHVSMSEVADAAGVGKGTLFRRFGDRPTLARAVLSERERRFQEAMIRGAPPLGPGAPPVERLMAFGREYMRFAEGHIELLKAAESTPRGSRQRGAPFELYVTHLALLVRAADPSLDSAYIASVLYSSLTADMVDYFRRIRGMDCARLHAGWETLVRRLLGAC